VTAPARPAWEPTPAQVHTAIPTRPAFGGASVPSDTQVLAIIQRTTDALLAEIPTLPVEYEPIAHAFVLYRTAAEVEWSYDPEQQFGGDNAQAPHLDQMAGAELARLRALTGSEIGTGGTAVPVVRGAFTIRPASAGPAVV
jgi:hypothetical protein